MKQIPTLVHGASMRRKNTIVLLITLSLLFWSLVSRAQSNSNNSGQQVIPELVFQNPTLVSGSDKKENAVYRFNNVATGVDALLEIKKFSDTNTVIRNLDLTQFGWNKAFQPELGRTGNVPTNQNWWVRFRMTFLKAGTNDKVKLAKFYVTALDVDGDGQSIQEYVQMQNVDSIKLSSITVLSLATPLNFGLLNMPNDKLAQGPVQNFLNVDTAATAAMVTYTYINEDAFDFTLGARSGSSVSNAGLRMNSLWFKSFSLAPQVALPLNLLSFQASLVNKKPVFNWSVAENETGERMELERSSDGIHFNTGALIFTTSKAGYENYTYKESKELTSKTYFRLKLINKDNSVSYSKTVFLSGDAAATNNTITMLQNPVVSSLAFNFTASENGAAAISIYNMSGVKVQGFSVNMNRGSNSINQTLNSNVVRGSYILEVVMAGEKAATRFIR